MRGYGTEAEAMLDGAGAADDLGERFGWDLTEREVRWLMEREWALTAEDVLWRRTKLGLRLTPARRGGSGNGWRGRAIGATGAPRADRAAALRSARQFRRHPPALTKLS